MQSSVGLHGPRRQTSVYHKGVQVTDSRVSRLLAWRRSSQPEFSVRSISQADADATIRAAGTDGAYIFRKSSAESGSIVLSMGWGGQVQHFVLGIPVDAFDTGNLNRCLRRFVKRHSKHRNNQLPGLLKLLVTDVVCTNINPLAVFDESWATPEPCEAYASIVDVGYHEVGDAEDDDNNDIFEDTGTSEQGRVFDKDHHTHNNRNHNHNNNNNNNNHNNNYNNNHNHNNYNHNQNHNNHNHNHDTIKEEPEGIYARIGDDVDSVVSEIPDTSSDMHGHELDSSNMETVYRSNNVDPLYSQIEDALKASRNKTTGLKEPEIIYQGSITRTEYESIDPLSPAGTPTKSHRDSEVYATILNDDDAYDVPQDAVVALRNNTRSHRPTMFEPTPAVEPLYSITQKKNARPTLFEIPPKKAVVEPVYSRPHRISVSLYNGNISATTISTDDNSENEELDPTETDL